MTKSLAQKARAKAAKKADKPKAAKKADRPKAAKGKAPVGGSSFPKAVHTKGPKGVTCTQDEFIADVNGSVAFQSTGYPINPGQAGTFPWLSKQASLYEKWSMESCEFYYVPTVSGYSTNGQSGKVLLHCDYDALDPAPTNKTQVEAAYLHADGMPYEAFRMRIDPKECNDRGGRGGKYIRPGPPAGGADIRLYDGGNLFLSVVGCQNATTIGELRVRYTVRLTVPVLESGGGPGLGRPCAEYVNSSPQSMPQGAASTLLLDTEVINNIGVVAGEIYGSWLLPAGEYLVDTFSAIEETTAAGGLFKVFHEVLNDIEGSPALMGDPSHWQTKSAAADTLKHPATTRNHFTSDGTNPLWVRNTCSYTGTCAAQNSRLRITPF